MSNSSTAKASGKSGKDKKSGSRVLPPFLQKLKIITQTVPRDVAGWSEDGLSFCVFSKAFKDTLAMHFKGNIQTFVRQLHFYGFRKFEQKGCEFCFAHKFFKRDQPELIHKIRRKSRAENLDGFATTEEVHALEETVNDIKTTVDDLRSKLQHVSNKLGICYVSKVSQTMRPDSPDGSESRQRSSSTGVQPRKYSVPRQAPQQGGDSSMSVGNIQPQNMVPVQQQQPRSQNNMNMTRPAAPYSPSPSGGNIRVHPPRQNLDPQTAMELQQRQQFQRQMQQNQGPVQNGQMVDQGFTSSSTQLGTVKQEPNWTQQQSVPFAQQPPRPQGTPNNSAAQPNLDPEMIQRQHSLEFYPLANGDAYDHGMNMFDEDEDVKQQTEDMVLDYLDNFDGTSSSRNGDFGGFDFTE